VQSAELREQLLADLQSADEAADWVVDGLLRHGFDPIRVDGGQRTLGGKAVVDPSKQFPRRSRTRSESSACLLMVAWAASASIIALVSSFYSVGELANCALAASRTFSSARRSFASRFVSERELSLQDCDRPPKAVKSRLACSERRSLGPGAHRCSGPRMHKSLGPWGGKCGELLRRPSRS
jgi:hypothetical protein